MTFSDKNLHPKPMTAEPVHNLPTYRAEDLTTGGNQARIVLGSQTYNLRITRAGKLILTK